jgi:hypothetical protein
MQRIHVDRLRQAVQAARDAMQRANLDACDRGDLEEILNPVDRELNSTDPNPATLSTYLNSLARSLRSDPAALSAVKQLDAAMRDSGVAAHWEH